MKKLAALAAITAFLSVDLVGCATASDVDDGIVPGRRGDAGNGDADEEDADEEDTGTAKDSATTGTDAKADVKTDAPSTTDAKSDATDAGGTDAKTDVGGPTCSPATTSDCQSAENIGSVSGDSNADVVSKSGTGNSFLQATITEDDSGILSPKDLRVTITLKSTGGANYDLFAYLAPRKGDGGGIECSTITGQSNTNGDETVILTWEDEQGTFGKSDERIVSLEIRSATATCAGGWDLTVEGNK